MTDPTDDRRWLHDHVDPILDAEPVAPGWDAIADRLDGVAPAPASLPEPAHRRARTLLAVAAAVALFAGAVLAIRAVTGDEDPAGVTSGPGEAGWVVPAALPEGWSVTRAAAIDAPDGMAVVSVQVQTDRGTGVDLQLQLPGTLAVQDDPAGEAYAGGDPAIAWQGLPSLDAPTFGYVGRAPAADLVVAAGNQPEELAALQAEQDELTAARDAASDALLQYQVDHPTRGDDPIVDPELERLTAELEDAEQALADFRVTTAMPSGDPEVQAELRELVDALRPASTEEWRAFVDSAEGDVDDSLRSADTLAELLGADGPPTSEDPATPTTAALDDPSVDLPPAPDGWRQSAPATLVPTDRGAGLASNLTGLDLWFEVPRDQVAAGDTLPARIAARNATDAAIVVNECSDLLTTWGLVPSDEPDAALPGRTIIDCYDTPSHEVPAGEVVRWDLTWTQVEPGFVARTTGDGPMWEFLGALDPGAYLGTVSVPTSEGDLRMSIPVTVTEPRCEGLTDDLVERYVGLTGEEATSQANEDGFTYRVASIDGKPLALTDDLVCDRIDVDLINGTVARVSLG